MCLGNRQMAIIAFNAFTACLTSSAAECKFLVEDAGNGNVNNYRIFIGKTSPSMATLHYNTELVKKYDNTQKKLINVNAMVQTPCKADISLENDASVMINRNGVKPCLQKK